MKKSSHRWCRIKNIGRIYSMTQELYHPFKVIGSFFMLKVTDKNTYGDINLFNPQNRKSSAQIP